MVNLKPWKLVVAFFIAICSCDAHALQVSYSSTGPTFVINTLGESFTVCQASTPSLCNGYATSNFTYGAGFLQSDTGYQFYDWNTYSLIQTTYDTPAATYTTYYQGSRPMMRVTPKGSSFTIDGQGSLFGNSSSWLCFGNCVITVVFPNSAPSASNLSITTSEDTTGSAVASVSDPNAGDTHTLQLVTQPANGTAWISGDTLYFAPNGNWNGTTSFTYNVRDAAGAYSPTYTVSVTVNAVNDAPTAQNLSITTNEDTAGSASASVSDVDSGDTHTLQIVAQSANGTATISGDTLTFTPASNWNGTTSFTYNVRDAAGALSPTYAVSVTVNAVNDAPVAAAKTLNTNEDTAGTVTLSATDVEGNAVTFQIVSAPSASYGVAAISGSTLTFTPVANWNGTTTMTYRAMDTGGAYSAAVTVTLNVAAVNDAPTAQNLSITTNEDTAGSATASVSDVDSGDTHTLQIVAQSANGTATISGDTLIFTPAANWNGATSFTYNVKDAAGALSPTYTASVTVNAVNDAPVAAAKTLNTNEDTAGTVTLTATDVEGDSVTFQIVSAPSASYGVAAISGSTLTFTPVANWNGTTTMTYRAMDTGGAYSAAVTVTLNVAAVNDAPTAQNLSITTNEDTAGSATASVSDVDSGDTHTLQIVAQSANGTATISGDTLTFTPAANWNGATSFTYNVKDAAGALSPTYTVSVTVTAVNDAPTAQNLSITTNEDTAGSATATVSDVDSGDTHTLQIVAQSANGTATISGDTLTFTPTTNWNGTTSFTYKVKDAAGAFSPTYTVSVTVTAVNDAPTAQNLSITTNEDTAGSSAATVGDVDAGDTHTLQIVAQSANGTATISGDTLTFTPAANWNGTTSFTYNVKDAAGALSPTYTVSVTVTAVNDAPTAQNLSITTNEDTAGSASATVSDVDSGDTHTLQIVAQSSYGTATVSGDTLTFIPNSNWNGATSFTYKAKDAAGALSTAYTVNVTVTPVNDAPSASQVGIVTNESRSGQQTVVVTDPDAGDTHTLTATQPAVGSVVVSGMNLTYTPPDSWFGTTSFTYKVTDAGGLSSSVMTSSVTVTKTNYAPTATLLSIMTNEDQDSAASTPAVTDPNSYDTGTHTIEIVGQPAHGALKLENGGRSVIYTPAFAYVGTDTFDYNVVDPAGAKVGGTANVTVVAFNYAPISTTAILVGDEDQLVGPTAPVTNDPNAWDTIRYEIVTQPAHGRASVSGGKLQVVPDEGFYGTDQFTFRAIDDAGEAVEGTATVTVNKFNYAPLDITPASIDVIKGVGGWADLQTKDRNLWDSFTYSVVTQPLTGRAWVEGDRLFFAAADNNDAVVKIRTTDSGGLFFEKNILLKAASPAAWAAAKTVVPLGNDTKVPSITTVLRDSSGRAAIYELLNTHPELAENIDRGIVVYVAPESTVGVVIEGRTLSPGDAAYLTKISVITPQAFELETAAVNVGDSGHAIVRFGPYYGSDTLYEKAVDVWTIHGAISVAKSPVIQAVEPTAANVVALNSGDCSVTGLISVAKSRSPFVAPTCFVEWVEKYPGATDVSTSDRVRLEGASTVVGVNPLKATAYVVDSSGNKYRLADVDGQFEVQPIEGALGIAPREPLEGTLSDVQEVEAIFTQNKGPACTLTLNLQKAKRDAQSNFATATCLVEWVSFPDGMQQRGNYDKPYLVGTINHLGENSISWRISVFDSAGNQYMSGEQQYVFNTVQPPAITFSMDARSLLGGDLYSAPMSGGYIGDIVATGYSAPIKFRISIDGQLMDEQVVPRGFGSKLNVRRRVEPAASNVLWTHHVYDFSAEYAALPTSYTSQRLDVVSVPDSTIMPVIDDTNVKVLTTEALDLDVRMLDVLNQSKPYSVDTMGSWSIQLVSITGWNKASPLTDAVDVDSDGVAHFSIPMDGLAGSNLRIAAVAKLNSPLPEYSSSRTSQKQLYVSVLNGDALTAGLHASRLSGPAPFRTTIIADMAKPEWYRDIGSVEWEVSNNAGETWTPVSSDSMAASVTRLAKTFSTKGHYLIRATITNKNSGEKATVAPIELNVFEVPAARMFGPTSVFVGSAGHYHLKNLRGEALDDSDKVVEWSLDKGVTWTAGGLDYDVQSAELGTKYLYARIRYQDAPSDNPLAFKLMKGAATFRPIREPRVQIVGPIRPEVGVKADYRAIVRMPYSGMEGTTAGEFTLPDGTVVSGTTASYTPTVADRDAGIAEIAYHAWVEGFKDDGAETTVSQRLRFWFYDWPSFSILPQISAGFAPADVHLRVRRDSGFMELDGVNYSWHLPEDQAIQIVKDSLPDSRDLKITAAGDYTFSVDVTDARGNSATAQLHLKIEEAPPYVMNLKYYGSNKASRAPLDISMRPEISGGHPLDRIETFSYLIDGQTVDGATDRYSTLRLKEPGTYTVGLRISSKMGFETTAEKTVVVVENQVPTCTMKVAEGASSWTAQAACNDVDGRMTGYKWTVNGIDEALTSSSITISKLKAPTAPSISVVGVDDAGGQSQVVNW